MVGGVVVVDRGKFGADFVVVANSLNTSGLGPEQSSVGLELGGAIAGCSVRSSARCGHGFRLAECCGDPVQLAGDSCGWNRDACRDSCGTGIGSIARSDRFGHDVAAWRRREVGGHCCRAWSALQLADLAQYCRFIVASFASDEAPM